jgi:hypothetical protein
MMLAAINKIRRISAQNPGKPEDVMKQILFVCSLAICCVIGTGSVRAGPTWAFWDFNNTTGATANDLTLTFSSNITNNLRQVQNNPMTSATVNGRSVTFDAANAGQNVPSQANCPRNFPSCSQDFGMTLLVPGPTRLVSAQWSLLSGGNANVIPLPNIFVIAGRVNNNAVGTISITNNDTQLVYFEGTDAATDIDPTVLSTMIADNDVGSELDANPADNANAVAEGGFSLAPGQTETFTLGSDDPGDYTSVVFAESYDPTFQTDDTYTVGYAMDVPEPPALLLFTVSLAALFWLRARQARAA